MRGPRTGQGAASGGVGYLSRAMAADPTTAANDPGNDGAGVAGPVCGNCGTPLLGDYCYRCGQPIKGLVRHFGSIMGDFLDSVFNIDARFPHTIWPLFARPGRLVKARLKVKSPAFSLKVVVAIPSRRKSAPALTW